jgi:alkaline phosphatase D
MKRDGSVRRRDVLRGASLVTAASVTQLGCGSSDEPGTTPPPREVFLHGIASGDPLADAVILWTRVTSPDGAPVDVVWTVARDRELADVVASGSSSTDADRDHTVKVDVTGLEAGATYYYAFDALEERSPIGRTRCAPSGATSRLRFVVCSCSSYAHGHFNAYQRIAERLDLDVVLHLGDYIYEYGDDEYSDPELEEPRLYDPPHEIITLEDYRRRYAHYRADSDLQAVHQQHPFICIWDDHESANDSFPDGAENHASSEGAWADRKADAIRAYFEWMPIRDNDDKKVWRTFRYGDLVDLIMLDTRLWGRQQQSELGEDPPLDPERQILGDDQEAWLFDQLETSSATWRLLGQQVMMGQLGLVTNPDQWDGYPAARERLFDVLTGSSIDNVVVLTGDIHSSWGMDLTYDPFDATAYDPNDGTGSVAVEFVTPAITSPGFPEALGPVAEGLKADNPHMKLVDLVQRGYVVLDITAERVEAAWYHVDTIKTPSGGESLFGVVASLAGSNHLVEQSEASAAPTDVPPPAPG